MDIDTDKQPPKPIEECLESLKDIRSMVHDLKSDIAFIKITLKEKEKVPIEKSWYLF
tara:strand:+ start:284 stop:454 length:171 start_codon:yes stop_codon:yes gene_type:complete